MLSSAPDKAKLFPKSFSENANLNNSGIALPAFRSRANLKQHNILVSRKLVQKVMTDFDSFKSSGPDDCIPVMDLKNSEPELSYILAEFCNICLKESYFPVCWKVSSVRSACI